MKKGLKRVVIAFVVLVIVFAAVFSTVFLLAKQKKIFINKWFVDEKNSTIGVDVSSYQADIDMNKLKEQKIEFIYMKATERSNSQDDRFAENWENAKKAGKMREVERLTRVRNETVTSQTGILMKADELVSYYIDNDCFPGIWIYDELCVNGHDFSELICSLEDAVCSAWEMQQKNNTR